MYKLEDIKACASRIRKRYGRIFASSFFAGAVAYGFVMFNVVNNWDSVHECIGGYGAGLEVGRWLLSLLGDFFGSVCGNYALPPFTGLAATALLSLSACVAVRILHIDNEYLAMASAALFVVFPAAAGMMVYMFTAGYYALAVFFAVLGAYETCRGGVHTVAGAALFACSLGIYQAYLPLAASLLVLSLIRECFESDMSAARMIAKCFHHLFTLALGVVLYFAALRLCLYIFDATLISYQGADSMGLNVRELPRMIERAYGEMAALTFRPVYNVNDAPSSRAFICAAYALSALMFFACVVKSDCGKAKKLLACVLLLLLPLAADSIVIMSYHSFIHMLMAYAMACVFLLPAELYCMTGRVLSPNARKNNCRTSRFASTCAYALTLAVITLSSLCYIRQSNGNFLVLYYTNTQTTEYFSTVVTRIKSADGYRADLKLAVIGDEFHDISYKNIAYTASPFRYSASSETMLNTYSRAEWMAYYLGFAPEYASEAETASLAARDDVRAMPCYPDDGSIDVIGDYVVLKLEDK